MKISKKGFLNLVSEHAYFQFKLFVNITIAQVLWVGGVFTWLSVAFVVFTLLEQNNATPLQTRVADIILSTAVLFLFVGVLCWFIFTSYINFKKLGKNTKELK